LINTPEEIGTEAGQFLERIIFGENLNVYLNYLDDGDAEVILDLNNWR
jgi:hypothetical protein